MVSGLWSIVYCRSHLSAHYLGSAPCPNREANRHNFRPHSLKIREARDYYPSGSIADCRPHHQYQGPRTMHNLRNCRCRDSLLRLMNCHPSLPTQSSSGKSQQTGIFGDFFPQTQSDPGWSFTSHTSSVFDAKGPSLLWGRSELRALLMVLAPA